MPIVILVTGIQRLAFFFGRRPVVVGTRLLHRVVILIDDIGHPAVLVVPAKPESMGAVGKILQAGHTRSVIIREIPLKDDLPAVSAPVKAVQSPAPLVADHIKLVI